MRWFLFGTLLLAWLFSSRGFAEMPGDTHTGGDTVVNGSVDISLPTSVDRQGRFCQVSIGKWAVGAALLMGGVASAYFLWPSRLSTSNVHWSVIKGSPGNLYPRTAASDYSANRVSEFRALIKDRARFSSYVEEKEKALQSMKSEFEHRTDDIPVVNGQRPLPTDLEEMEGRILNLEAHLKRIHEHPANPLKKDPHRNPTDSDIDDLAQWLANY